MNGGKRKRILCVLLAVCLTAVLSGCTGRVNEEKPASPTLAPAEVSFRAPDGDRAVRHAGYYSIYAPKTNELQLSSRSVYLEEINLETTAETLARMVLEEADTADGSCRCTGERRRRSAAGSAPSTWIRPRCS